MFAALQLVALIVFFEAIGLIGEFLTRPARSTWYASLRKPSWTPSEKLFAPVWGVLYLLMAIGTWIVLQLPYHNTAMAWLVGLLILNFMWTYVFFKQKNMQSAFAELTILWIMAVVTTLCFFSLSVAAAVLMLPVVAWITFAGVLNIQVWMMNPPSNEIGARHDLVSKGPTL
ncbi:MAG TPA: TspO/MBR family protein [Fimbriimonas sp.]|nr:TspO/MBR family protein [Fimbriimonas sp.]